MAAPHVAATAALVIATGVLGARPDADADRAPPEGDRARPRPPGLRPPLRRGPARRRRGDGAASGGARAAGYRSSG